MEQHAALAQRIHRQQDVAGRKERHHEKTPGIYPDRTLGGDRYHRLADGDIDAGPESGKETGTIGCVSDEPAPMGPDLGDVLPR